MHISYKRVSFIWKFRQFVTHWSLNQEDQTILDHFPANLKKGCQIGKSEEIAFRETRFWLLSKILQNWCIYHKKSVLDMKIWTICDIMAFKFWRSDHFWPFPSHFKIKMSDRPATTGLAAEARRTISIYTFLSMDYIGEKSVAEYWGSELGLPTFSSAPQELGLRAWFTNFRWAPQEL